MQPVPVMCLVITAYAIALTGKKTSFRPTSPRAIPPRQVCHRGARGQATGLGTEVVVHDVPLTALAKVALFNNGWQQ